MATDDGDEEEEDDARDVQQTLAHRPVQQSLAAVVGHYCSPELAVRLDRTVLIVSMRQQQLAIG